MGSAWAQDATASPSDGTPAGDRAPSDLPYPGTIRLSVDASDTARHILRVREIIPLARSGPMTLLYPRWIPGYHRPAGRIDELAGLTVLAGEQTIPWTRDAEDGFSFALDVPEGATELEIAFQIVTPVADNQGRVVMTPEMLNLQWNKVLLYPAGHYASRIMVEPSIVLPNGWQAGTALEAAANANNMITYGPVSLETLVDSPMFAGLNFERVDLDPEAEVPFHLNIVADDLTDLAFSDDQIEAHRSLVQQAYRLFDSRHFDHYDFLLALTDSMSGIGLEHHRSSENAVPRGYFTEWDNFTDVRDLLAHELVHSWNGKFRRPADLWVPNFNVPMRDSLLWVYEGQTHYWGYVLSARSGLWTKQEALDGIAWLAATYDNVAGRQWRSLQDTTNDPILAARRPIPWRSWQRSEDYYSEGLLIWLDADTLIRELSGGTRSLDDFASAFFGIDDGSFEVRTYTFDDLLAALNSVQPYDWASFLRSRLDRVGAPAPLDGIARGGYRLVYTEKPSEHFRSSEIRRGVTDLSFSLGVVIGRDNSLTGVLWEGPAYDAGLTVGNEIVAVDGREFNSERIRDSVARAMNSPAPIVLIVKDGEHYRTVELPYHDGLRYPHLERVADNAARLDEILAPRP
jgi:predicted metalloprotease with PDZ domain